jgi:molybdopterin-guanine dinucleotide biosynthesis protein A
MAGAGATLGVILAGGASKRFGSNKALAALNGRAIVAHVAARAAPQVDLLVLNAADDGARTGLPVVPDLTAGEGPLSGWIAGLRQAKADGFSLMATFACDTPHFPADTTNRLRVAIAGGVDCAMARHDGQVHHTFALVRTAALSRIEEAYAGGMRRLRAVGGILSCALPDFSDCRDGPNGDAFFNINTQEDLAVFGAWWRDHGHDL